MKESTLLEMKTRIEQLGAVCQMLVQEMGNLKDLSIGTLELIKQFEDYEPSVERLKQSYLDKKLLAEAEEKVKENKLET